MMPLLSGWTARVITRPDVTAGPMNRARSPENVSLVKSRRDVSAALCARARCWAPATLARSATLNEMLNHPEGDRRPRNMTEDPVNWRAKKVAPEAARRQGIARRLPRQRTRLTPD